VAQAALQGGIAVQRTEIAEQLAGAGEQHGVAIDHRLMGDVLRKHRFADAVLPDKHDVGVHAPHSAGARNIRSHSVHKAFPAGQDRLATVERRSA
jgi:hypothetical protein